MTTDWRDVLLTAMASTGGLALAVALLLVVALRWLLPVSSRAAVKLPAALLVIHLLLVLAQLVLPPDHEIRRTLSVGGLFVLLASLGRSY